MPDPSQIQQQGNATPGSSGGMGETIGKIASFVGTMLNPQVAQEKRREGFQEKQQERQGALGVAGGEIAGGQPIDTKSLAAMGFSPAFVGMLDAESKRSAKNRADMLGKVDSLPVSPEEKAILKFNLGSNPDPMTEKLIGSIFTAHE